MSIVIKEISLSPALLEKMMILILEGMADLQEKEGFSEHELIVGHMFAIGAVLHKTGVRIDLNKPVTEVLEPLAKGYQRMADQKKNFH